MAIRTGNLPPNNMLNIENREILNRPMVQLNAANTRLNPLGHVNALYTELMFSRRLFGLIVAELLPLP